jgi:methyl-accepting chemotaxis protein
MLTDQVFRIIIAVAVGLACIMVVVQAFVMIGLLKVVRRMEQRFEPLAHRAGPVIENLGAITARIGPVVDDATPMIEKIGTVIEKLGPAVDKLGTAFDKVAPLVDKLGIAADQAGKILTNTNRIIEETRPRISEVSSEVAAISHSGREQVERLGELLQDAGERARNRLEQIDHTVENTVEQVEQVGDAVKRTVMRPVREVNGIAAGISAAVSSLVGKPRKYSVDSATQDEEMFI